MAVEVLIAAGLLAWGGSALLIDAWLNRRYRPTLAERLAPFRGQVADEAQAWLRKH